MDTVTSGTSTPTVDKLVKTFVKIRDARDKVVREAEEEAKGLQVQLDLIKSALLEHCKTNMVDSVKTEFGTFIRGIKTRYWTNDWENFGKFAVENNASDLYEKRLHQGNMAQFIEENPEKIPPGLNVDKEYTITVRRK